MKVRNKVQKREIRKSRRNVLIPKLTAKQKDGKIPPAKNRRKNIRSGLIFRFCCDRQINSASTADFTLVCSLLGFGQDGCTPSAQWWFHKGIGREDFCWRHCLPYSNGQTRLLAVRQHQAQVWATTAILAQAWPRMLPPGADLAASS